MKQYITIDKKHYYNIHQNEICNNFTAENVLRKSVT